MNYMENICAEADALLYNNTFSAFEGYDEVEDADYIKMLMESDNDLINLSGDLLNTKADKKRAEAVDKVTYTCKERINNAKKQKNINKALGAIGVLMTGLTGASAASNGVTNTATIVSAAVTAAIGIAKGAHNVAVVQKETQKIDDYIDEAIVKTEEVIASGKGGNREDARALVELRDSLKKEKKRLHMVLPI